MLINSKRVSTLNDADPLIKIEDINRKQYGAMIFTSCSKQSR